MRNETEERRNDSGETNGETIDGKIGQQKATPAKPNPDVVTIYGEPGGDPAADVAQAYLRPTIQAASIVRTLTKGKDGIGPEINALVAELGKQAQLVSGGNLKRAEAMLIAQAHSLDAIFGNMVARATMNFGEYLHAAETYMRLALKAQSQCRATLETLALIKNPPNVAFVRQANIAAGPQQVNNAAAPQGEGSRTRENENLQNKLLEAQHGERLEFGTASTAIGPDPHLETVGVVNRAEVVRR